MMNFVHIPKVAGSSFWNLISTPTKKRPNGYLDIVTYRGHTQAMYIPNPSFCFVRNPYVRLVSAYNYLVKDRGQELPDFFYRTKLLKYRDFKDFVFHIEEHNLNQFIMHVQPMSFYICDYYDKIMVDFIFQIEYPKLIDNFLRDIGINKKLSSVFVNVHPHKDYNQYLDAEIKAEIERLYALDFELFHY